MRRQAATRGEIAGQVEQRERLLRGAHAKQRAVEAPAWLDDADAREDRGGVTVAAKSPVVGAPLLQHGLECESVFCATRDEAAERVAAIVASVHVGPRLRRRALGSAPAAHVHAQFRSAAFHDQFLERGNWK